MESKAALQTLRCACRQQWLAACHGALGDAPFWEALGEASASTARGLRGMLEVLVGSHEALQGATVGWLELLVSELLHAYPTLHPASHLVPLLERCQRDMAGAGLGRQDATPSPLLPIVDGLMHVRLSPFAWDQMFIVSPNFQLRPGPGGLGEIGRAHV